MEILHWCSPDMHGGERVPANFVLKDPEADDVFDIGIATCAEHAGQAIDTLLMRREGAVNMKIDVRLVRPPLVS